MARFRRVYALGMTTEQPKQRSYSGLWLVLASVVVLGLVCSICVPNFVRSGPGKTSFIINNLRQLDGAKQQWALDHGRTGAIQVTTQDIAPYLTHSHAKDGLVKPVAGERYSLRTLIESPEAILTREVDGRPKGTVFRLGTDSIEIIIGPTNGLRQ